MPFRLRSRSGGGGGLHFRVPPDLFAGANLAAAAAARDAYFGAPANAAALGEFQGDGSLAIVLRRGEADETFQTYLPGQAGQAYDATRWKNRLDAVQSIQPPSDAQVADAVQDGVKPFARTGGPVTPADEIDPGILRRAEVTKDFLLGIIGLTADEINDLFTDAVVRGSGATRTVVITQADDTTITLVLPAAAGGGEGGEGGDGVVQGAAFANDGSELMLTLSTGVVLRADVPASLRQAGLSQSQVQALIDAAEADDIDAADVAAQIRSVLAVRVPGRASYIAPLVLSSYASQLNAPPAQGRVVIGASDGNGRPVSISLASVDAHVGPYLDGFVGRDMTVRRVSNGTIAYRGRLTGVAHASGVYTLSNTQIANSALTLGAPVTVEFESVLWPGVISYAVNTIVHRRYRGWTYVQTGNAESRLSLPSVSGGNPVEDGWDVVAANRSTANQIVAPDGADRINGNALLTIAPGHSVHLRKAADGQWIIIADTARGSGLDAAAVNAIVTAQLGLYQRRGAVVESAVDQNIAAAGRDNLYRLTGNDARTYTLPDASGEGSVTDGWDAWFTTVAADLTIRANAGDTINGSATLVIAAGRAVRLRKVADGAWIIIADSAIGTGGGADTTARAAAAAAQARADANKQVVDRLTVFETAELTPGGIPGNTFPEFVSLRLDGKVRSERIAQIQVALDGSAVIATVNVAEAIAAFNGFTAIEDRAVGIGGIINCSLDAAARNNLRDAVGSAAQYMRCDIRYKFEGTSLNVDVEPDVTDFVHFGINNNAYRFDVTQIGDGALTEAKLAAAVRAKLLTRFERAIGNSPAVLPAGTYKIKPIVKTLHNQVARSVAPPSIPVSELPAAQEVWVLEGANPTSPDNQKDIVITMSYVAASRTLTYAIGGTGGDIQSSKLLAIGLE